MTHKTSRVSTGVVVMAARIV